MRADRDLTILAGGALLMAAVAAIGQGVGCGRGWPGCGCDAGVVGTEAVRGAQLGFVQVDNYAIIDAKSEKARCGNSTPSRVLKDLIRRGNSGRWKWRPISGEP